MNFSGSLPKILWSIFQQEFKERWLSACSKIGNKALDRAQVFEKVENIRNVGAYVSKYLQKSFTPDSDNKEASDTWWRWMELCYREHVRVYAMDSRSSKYISRKYPKKDNGIGEALVFSGFDEVPDVDEVPAAIPEKHRSEENSHPPEQQPILSTAPVVGGGAKPEGTATSARSGPALASGRGRRVLGAI